MTLAAGSTGTNSGEIGGGNGGYGITHGGVGGAGLIADAARFVNTANIAGGIGGYSYFGSNHNELGGSGGAGADLSDHATLTNSGRILGGHGVYGVYTGSAGGVGVYAHDSNLTSTGTITGGDGNYGSIGYGGVGGIGVDALYASIVNSGTVTGGKAGENSDRVRAYQAYGGAGVALNGSTLETSGTITGGMNSPDIGGIALAVSFGGDPSTLIIDPGAVFNGLVLANVYANDALDLGGTKAATLTGLGSEFRNFASLGVESGAKWTLTGPNTTADLTVQGSLTAAGTLTNSGDATLESGGRLTVSGSLLAGSLTLAGGQLAGSASGTTVIGSSLAGATAAHILLENGATITGYGLLGGAPVIDEGGTIKAANGSLVLGSRLSGSGNLTIGAGAAVEAKSGISGVSITFAGAGHLLADAPTAMTSTITGFAAKDVIDLAKLTVTSLSFSSGILKLRNGSTVVDKLTFAGSYTKANFVLSSDGNGGADVSFVASKATLAPSLSDFEGLMEHGRGYDGRAGHAHFLARLTQSACGRVGPIGLERNAPRQRSLK